jgi:hypothetical protein
MVQSSTRLYRFPGADRKAMFASLDRICYFFDGGITYHEGYAFGSHSWKS